MHYPAQTPEKKDRYQIRIRDAVPGRTFPWALEYNCPVHEHWNIVHTGMLIPECHQIYICTDNCLRGVIMTADEMCAADRISSVMPDETEIMDGSLEDVTIRGVIDVIRKLKKKPRAVQLFPVCMHHFIGCDMRYIFDQVEKAFPEIDFMECFMDPIRQKLTTTPEMRQRFQMMKVLATPKREPDLTQVSMLGENLRVQDSDFQVLLRQEGFHLLQVQDCRTYDDYLAMGNAFLWLTRSPLSRYGLEKAAALADRRSMYLPAAVTYDEIDCQLYNLMALLYEARRLPLEMAKERTDAWIREQRALTEEAFQSARKCIGDTPVIVDYICVPRPVGFARLLLEHGMNVVRILADSISPEEAEDLAVLQEEHPDLALMSTSAPGSLAEAERIQNETSGAEQKEKILAVGPKAAFFSDSSCFVNAIEADGATGYMGIRHMLQLMCDALTRPGQPEVVTGKGLGLPGVWTEPSCGDDCTTGVFLI
ncbi:MAG: nitrogenase component 1 [Eubacterium sp.]|nr:nitrogenase component 1 [Eubacterium sp.]